MPGYFFNNVFHVNYIEKQDSKVINFTIVKLYF